MENWKPIKGFPDYSVSDLGRIAKHEEVVEPHRNGDGYLFLTFGRKNRYIHRLVLMAFRGDCPNGKICRHLDGNPANNAVDNLTWGTYAQNEADKLLHGTRARGSLQGSAKLNEASALEIRKLALSGFSQRQLARIYKVSQQAIQYVTSGETWKHVGFPAARRGE